MHGKMPNDRTTAVDVGIKIHDFFNLLPPLKETELEYAGHNSVVARAEYRVYLTCSMARVRGVFKLLQEEALLPISPP